MRTRTFLSTVLLGLLLTRCVGGGAAKRSDVANLQQGMTKQQVVDKLGRPWDINRSDYGDYTKTQFVYQEAYTTADRLYIYFRNGRLTSTQY